MRGFFSKSKKGGKFKENKDLWREFWLSTSAELQSQLHRLAVTADIDTQALGNVASIVKNEMNR